MDLIDLQFRITEMVREPANLPGIHGGHPAAMPGLAPYLGAPEHDVVAALDLLAQRGLLRVRAWARDDCPPGRSEVLHFLSAPSG